MQILLITHLLKIETLGATFRDLILPFFFAGMEKT